MYSVNLHGHKDFPEGTTREEIEQWERDLIEKVTAFAHSLPALGGGTVNTETQPQTVLQPSDGAEATNPDGSPVEQDSPTAGVHDPDASLAAIDVPGTQEGTLRDALTPPAPDEVKQPGSADSSSGDIANLSTADLQAELARRQAQ